MVIQTLVVCVLVAQADDQPAAPSLTVEPRVLWEVELTSDSKGSGAIADIDGDGKPEVVFGTYFRDRHLYALNGEDGSLCWKHLSDQGPMDASVLIADHDGDGTLEILSADSSSGRIFCLDGQGRLVWVFKLPNSTDSPPSIADLTGDGRLDIVAGSMWMGDGVGAVTSFDAITREVHWTARVPGCVQSEPVLVELDDEEGLDVVVTSWRGDRSVHALSGKTGDPIWRFETAGDGESMGMYHGVSVLDDLAEPRLVIGTTEGDVYCLDRNGNELWSTHFDEYLFAPTTAADLDGDGALELCVIGRSLHLLRATDGEELWKRDYTQTCARGIAIADVNGNGSPDLVFAVGTVLFALSGDGAEICRIDLGQKDDPYANIGGVLLSDLDGDGFVDAFCVVGRGHYGGDNKGEDNHGRAVAIRLGRGSGSWETFRGGPKRTGVIAD